MIIYFSATGNSKYVAKSIADSLNDDFKSIEILNNKISLKKGECLGIVVPTYFWELPYNVQEFLRNLELTCEETPYIFLVSTYGTTPGASFQHGKHILSKRNLKLNAGFGIKMPDNWTPRFDLSNPQKVAKQNKEAESYIVDAITKIKNKENGNFMEKSAPYFLRYFSDIAYNHFRNTKYFKLEDNCNGCGLCAKKCPDSAIEIKNKKAVWVKNKCNLCLGCLHRCPKFAIQFEHGNTKEHGQYKNPHVKV